MTARAAGLRIRLLADDLTGALDSAAAFAGSMAVHLDEAPRGACGALVAVATATRDIAPAALPQRLAGLLDWFVAGDVAFKKVDSLLRGNTFAECAYLARAGGFTGLVFAPAFPGQRRITASGRQFVLPAEGAAADAPVPVGEPIAAAFAGHGLETVQSVDAPVAMSAGASPAGSAAPVVWLPDVRTDADLLCIAALALPSPAQSLPGRWLWCGSAGLAHALAGVMAAAPSPAATPGSEAPRPVGAAGRRGILMLGASHHPVVRAQWQRLRAHWPQVIGVAEGDEAQFADACTALTQPFDVAALELSPRHPLTPAQAAALLERQLAELAARPAAPARLLVVGGDTLLGVCRATGVRLLRTLPSVRAGWGRARLVGGRWDGVECHSRSGAFGAVEDLDEMLRVAAAG